MISAGNLLFQKKALTEDRCNLQRDGLPDCMEKNAQLGMNGVVEIYHLQFLKVQNLFESFIEKLLAIWYFPYWLSTMLGF